MLFRSDNIRKVIEKSIQRRLNLLDVNTIAYTDYRNLTAMEKEINSWAQEAVKKQYGLVISIENLKRDRTLEETWKSEDARKVLEDQCRSRDIQRQIKMDKVDEAVAQLAEEKVIRKIRIDAITAGNRSTAAELELLRKQRSELISKRRYDDDSEEEQETLDRVEKEIKRLERDRKSTRLNSSHVSQSRMPSSA